LWASLWLVISNLMVRVKKNTWIELLALYTRMTAVEPLDTLDFLNINGNRAFGYIPHELL